MTFIASLTEKAPRSPHTVPGRASWSTPTPGARLCSASRRARRRCRACGATGRPCTWRSPPSPRRDCSSSRSPAPTSASPRWLRPHTPALRLERTIRDLYGLEPEGSPDPRPWLDHGRWGVRQPLGARTSDPAVGDAYAFLSAEGPPLHQIPVGPVHAGIIEPGHFRFSCNGEAVVRLEERLGYVHKGIDALMQGAPLDKAAKLAGARLRRQHGRLRASPSRARWRQPSGSSRRRARSSCAR